MQSANLSHAVYDKMGFAVLQFLKALVPLVRKLGPRANPGVLRNVPLKAYAVWALYAGEPIDADTGWILQLPADTPFAKMSCDAWFDRCC